MSIRVVTRLFNSYNNLPSEIKQANTSNFQNYTLTGECPKVFKDFRAEKVAIFGQIWSNFALIKVLSCL